MSWIPYFDEYNLKVFSDGFWHKIDIKGEDDCWPWTKSVVSEKKPYGRVKVNGRLELAHVIVYELTHKEELPLSDDTQICHSCDNPICCNPKHLWKGNNKSNMLDKTRKNRQSTSGGPEGKFTYDEWQNIIELHNKGWSNTDIGRNYQSYDTTIRRVLAAGESYRYKGKV